MSGTTATDRRTSRRFMLALAGLALALVSPLFWALTLETDFLQRTALAMWLGMTAGLLCAALAAWADRRKRTRIVAALTGLWVLLSVPGYLVLTRLPAAKEVGSVERVADLILPDHLGRPTSLAGLLSESPVLLVFYRGHW